MLTGKAALVTGAGRGIGKEIALTLAKEGADIALNYNGSKEAAEETAMQIEGIGRKVILLPCNVSDFQACGAMVEQAEKEFGKIDILVNNAGITKDNLLLRMTEEEFNMVLDVNLKGSFYTIRHITKQMLKRR